MSTTLGEVTVEVGEKGDLPHFSPQDPMAQFQHLPPIHPGLIGLPPFPQMYPGHAELPRFAVSDMFVNGFAECAEETIRYLLDVEGLSENDPLVVGLKQHLFEKQRLLQLNLFLQNNLLLRAHHPHDECVGAVIKAEEDKQIFNDTGERYASSSEQDRISCDCKIECECSDTSNTINMIPEGSERLVSDLVDEIFFLLQEDDLEVDSDEEVDEGFDEMTEQEVVS